PQRQPRIPAGAGAPRARELSRPPVEQGRHVQRARTAGERPLRPGMDHRTAISTTAAERYFLDELDESERKDFEDHYFSCAECAAHVRDAATFLAAARPLLAPGIEPLQRAPRPSTQPGRLGGLALRLAASFAVVGLVGTVSYQRFVTIPRLEHEVIESELRGVEAGRTLPSFFLRSARGEPATVALSKGERFIVLRLSDSLEPSFPAYRYTLLDAT